VAFVVIRYLNGFGSTLHWDGHHFVSDFIISKYPPSLVFRLLTLGIMFFIWTLFIQYKPKLNMFLFKPLIIFGQTSLFFYIVHLYICMALVLIFMGKMFLSIFSNRGTFGFWVLYHITFCVVYTNN